MSDSLWVQGLSPTRLLHPWGCPGKNTGVGCHFLLQGIFPTQGSNPGLLHWRQMLYPLSHQGSPIQRLTGLPKPGETKEWMFGYTWPSVLCPHSHTMQGYLTNLELDLSIRGKKKKKKETSSPSNWTLHIYFNLTPFSSNN